MSYYNGNLLWGHFILLDFKRFVFLPSYLPGGKRRYVLLAVVVLLALPACSNLGYYAQSVGGQLEIMWGQEDIDELLRSRELEQQLKDKLSLVLKIREFASTKLGLPDNDSYKSYVDLQRPYVVWNVVAAPEFSMELKEWCFPFAGCIRYRGYFSEEAAKEYARELELQGMDVYVGGVAAYSTLGWFDDPVLNTVLNRDELGLAGLVFHELAHQQVYVQDDSAFNEGFATTVEIEGVRRWLRQNGDPDMAQTYRQRKQRRNDFVHLVLSTKEKLAVLYQQPLASEQMRRAKAEIISELKQTYVRLKSEQWQGYDGYDRWFAREINNAQIAAVGTYRDYVPAFEELLRQQQGDLHRFYKAVTQLGELPKEERNQRIQKLALQARASV